MTWSGLRISMSPGTSIWPAFTGPGAGGLQRHALGRVRDHADGDALEVEHDVGDVFADARDGREFVHHAVDLDRR